LHSYVPYEAFEIIEKENSLFYISSGHFLKEKLGGKRSLGGFYA
jgi:hypothetical protein